MATYNRPHMTAQQALLERVMREVVARVQDAGFVLKGGGALCFIYGAHRHTTDLDFDAQKRTDMTRRIRRATQAAGAEIDESTWWSSEREKKIKGINTLQGLFSRPQRRKAATPNRHSLSSETSIQGHRDR